MTPPVDPAAYHGGAGVARAACIAYGTWVLDADRLRSRLQAAAERFADDVVRLYAQSSENHIDLADDPRPWNAKRRSANTNGSVLLDQYGAMTTQATLRELGPAFVIAVLTIGVVTEPRALFRSP